MRIFVTGATGVIGTRVLPLLINAGHHVTAMTRSASNREMLAGLGAASVEADLFDVESLRRAMMGHDVVLNLATHVPSSAGRMMMRRAWRTNDRIRRDGSAAVAAAASAEGVRRLVQESFAPMYPDHGDAWIDESMPVAPAAYNASAVDAERSAMRFAERGGVGVGLRFGALYVPDSTTCDMLDMIRKGWSPLPGDPRAFFSSLAQDDAATAVVAALEVPSGIYNVVEDDPMRRGDWAASLARAAGARTPRQLPRWLVPLGGSVLRLLARSQRISNARFCKASSWRPRYPRASDAWDDVLEAMGFRSTVAR
jgi:nucleoside-diphosphate-sugar epimerase